MTITVLIADDQTLVRSGLRAIIESEPGMEVVGEAADGAEAVEAVRRLRPDVALRCTFSPLLAPIDREEGALLWDSLGSDGL